MKKPNKQNSPQQPKSSSSSKAAPVAVKEVGNEPTVARASMPVLLIALLVALVYWGNMYVVEYGGELDARVQGSYKNFAQIADLQPKGEEQEMMSKGLRVYNKPACSPCHQADGNGSSAQNAPPLAGSEWVLEKDPSRLVRIILHGLSGPIKVKDKEWGAGAMLAWKDTLTDEEIASVLTYVRNSWGNKAPPVKPDLAKKIREETKDYSGYMTVEELLKVPLKN